MCDPAYPDDAYTYQRGYEGKSSEPRKRGLGTGDRCSGAGTGGHPGLPSAIEPMLALRVAASRPDDHGWRQPDQGGARPG